MLTRLEVDGFKNLLGFSADFGPYACIAGPNAVGKSNVFVVIEFLSLLAHTPFLDAAATVRETADKSGDPRTLFWQEGEGYRDMTLGADMIVPRAVEDDFGRLVSPSVTYLRYELILRYIPAGTQGHARSGGIELISESLTPISRGVARKSLPWASKPFFDAVVVGTKKSPFISTGFEDELVAIEIHSDGGSRGRGQKSPARNAPRTIVATTTTIDAPTVLAAKREMQSWRKLALEPSAMRTPDVATDMSSIEADGRHIPATLNRLASERSEDVFAMVANQASALADVRRVNIDVDPHRDTLTLEAQVGTGPMLPARALSEGTLRFLALCVIAQDDGLEGLVCMEEPENGIHPARIGSMVELLRDMAVDPEEVPSAENPFRQVLVNTHSPYYVALHEDDELLVATPAAVKAKGIKARTLRLLPLVGTWRSASVNFSGSRQSIADYLRFPEDAPQTLGANKGAAA